MPSAKEQIADHLANRRVRPLIDCSRASQARSAYAAYAAYADFAERIWCKHCADLGFHVEDMCVTSAVSLWCRQVGCERALGAARRARARVTDLAIWRSCGGAP